MQRLYRNRSLGDILRGIETPRVSIGTGSIYSKRAGAAQFKLPESMPATEARYFIGPELLLSICHKQSDAMATWADQAAPDRCFISSLTIFVQRGERHGRRIEHAARIKEIHASRREISSTGLAGFLGKVSGITALRKAVQRYQDGKLMRAQQKDRAELKLSQDGAQRR